MLRMVLDHFQLLIATVTTGMVEVVGPGSEDDPEKMSDLSPLHGEPRKNLTFRIHHEDKKSCM